MKFNIARRKQLLGIMFTILSINLFAQKTISIYSPKGSPMLDFAMNDLRDELGSKGIDICKSDFSVANVLLLTQSEFIKIKSTGRKCPEIDFDLKQEGFCIRIDKLNITWVIGADEPGLMYGVLELTEQIKVAGLDKIEETSQNPYMAMRGTKFNIPLDVRSPSYSDAGDAAQKNIGEMWSFDFWKEYFDALARYRYNYISLWNLHPFPSMVKVPEYPDVALEDVQRSTVKWAEYYDLTGGEFGKPEIINNVEIVKKMTIEQKIDFWKKVMRYAKERNVDFYIITWNIFTYGVDGKYGITDKLENKTTKDYFRKSVKQMFLTYPDLKGIGLTTGEKMDGASFQQKEDWVYSTYGEGVLDVVKEQPGRKITFVHRAHQTGALEIAKTFRSLVDHPDIEFLYSFKYAVAHVYSSTKQVDHPKFVETIEKDTALKTIWTLRNDDVYMYRWCAPDFVREFIQNIPYEVSRGYYYGSDGYTWGREFLSTVPEDPRQIEIVKHEYQWMLWGRLGYNPALNNERIKAILGVRYPEIKGEKLFDAWQAASMVYPLVTGFHWGAVDYAWYIEACRSFRNQANNPTGYHDINSFISIEPHPGTDNVSIPHYVDALLAGKEITGTTPMALANRIEAYTQEALAIIDLYSGKLLDKDLALVLHDIRTMAYMGNYYAFKIRAAVKLETFRRTLKRDDLNEVEQLLKTSAMYWRAYVSRSATTTKNPIWTTRVGHVNWQDGFHSVLHELNTLGFSKEIPPVPATPGGTLLEAEAATKNEPETKISGYQGAGYIRGPNLTWTYEAPDAGIYLLEVRYGFYSFPNLYEDSQTGQITINNQPPQPFKMWTAGHENNWVRDCAIVKLKKGTNTIHLTGSWISWVDNVNVVPFYKEP